MKIKRLWISHKRCLKDFRIEFDISDKGASTVLIGENGAGKSTLMEAVLEIVSSFDSATVERNITYDYEFEYEYAECPILIKKEGHSYQLIIDGELFAQGVMKTIQNAMKERKISIFPRRIMAFYSGTNDKLIEFIKTPSHFRLFMKNYFHYLLHGDSENAGFFIKSVQPISKRQYNYFSDELIPILLISILGGTSSKASDYLVKRCDFTKIESIRIKLETKVLDTLSSFPDKKISLIEAFYSTVDLFENRLTQIFRNSCILDMDGKAFFEIENIQDAELDPIALYNFFTLLKEHLKAQIDVFVSYGDTRVNSSDMSEGQRQLIKILGMLGVCKTEDCLVLMDEPDAHMNPQWKYDIQTIIDDLLQEAEFTHALIATHDPLVINGMCKDKIRIFAKEEIVEEGAISYITKAITPEQDTIGLGIDGLLQSEYYGLNSVLDEETKAKMNQKHNLLIKRKDGTITPEETRTLLDLTTDLENLSFARNIPTDSYYDEYVAAMHKIYSERPKAKLTAEDIAERNAKAEEILRGLLGK